MMLKYIMTRYLLILLILSGCVSERKRAKICLTCPVKVSDSTWYKKYTTYRDSVLGIPSDTAEVRYIVEPCPDGSQPQVKPVETKQGRYTSIESKQNGSEFTVNAAAKPEPIKVSLPTTTVEKGSDRVEQLPCPEHSHWKFWVAIGGIVVVAGAGWVLYWIERLTG
jgi:hypothetical protein